MHAILNSWVHACTCYIKFMGINFRGACLISENVYPRNIPTVYTVYVHTKIHWLNSFKPLKIYRIAGHFRGVKFRSTRKR